MSNTQIVSIAVGLPLAAVCAFLAWYLQGSPPQEWKRLHIGETTVNVLIADTEATRQLGLGGRSGLESSQGMFFIFPDEGLHSFWMKDMLFPIDIIWIATDGSIVHIEKHVSPGTYPQSFAPQKPARYVLEVVAGYSDTHALSLGQKVGW